MSAVHILRQYTQEPLPMRRPVTFPTRLFLAFVTPLGSACLTELALPPWIVHGEAVTLVGAGDIATCTWEYDEETAGLLDHIPGTVFTVGDNVYPDGTRGDFASCYDPSWGRHKARTRPTPGNHDYNTDEASAYFDYFGDAAGPPGLGYYSYDVSSWHIIALNSDLDVGPGSLQEQWLRADLAASQNKCTLAYWHFPRFSSAAFETESDTSMTPLWDALYDAGADVVIAGHAHVYERFAPQTPDGALDHTNGIRQFTVGTGGAYLTGFGDPIPNSEVRISKLHGILVLSLLPGRYEWNLLTTTAGVQDSGNADCH